MRRATPLRLLTATALAVLASAFAASVGSAATTPVTFAKAYSNLVAGKQFSITPQDVQSTSEGGYIALSTTQSAAETAPEVSWLLKLSSTGAAQSEQELGCLGTPPGDFADGVSVAQTADGGYVVAGSTIGCGSGSDCPPESGIQCALVEKVSSTGAVQWAKVYAAGAFGSALTRIRVTSDGGFIAVGTATTSAEANGGLILKLSSEGNVQWQRQLGPKSKTEALLNDVRQTSDGGYVVTGQVQTPNSSGQTHASVLVAKLSSSGSVEWQKRFNSFSKGVATASNTAQSIVQSTDGGYAVAGNWVSSKQPGECCSGALVLKLASTGKLQFQKAYSGGLFCFESGDGERCVNLGAIVNSIAQTSEGSYVLGGEANLKMEDGAPLVPWIAKISSEGALVSEHDYYESASTGRPISEFFAASALTSDGGVFGGGFTENSSNGDGELLAVKTEGAGLAGASCSVVHTATALTAKNPAFTEASESLPVVTTVSGSAASPATTVTTSVATQSDC